MRRKPLLFIMLATALLTVACGGGTGENPDSDTNTRVVPITTASADIRDLPIWLKAVGRVHSQSAPTLAAEVNGRVTLVAADTGDTIQTGQLLARIDTSALLLRHQAAEAGLERLSVHIANGQRRVERLESLSAKDLASQTQLDDAREQLQAFRADYKAAKAQLAIVEDLLAKSEIVAPVSGVVQRRLIAQGDFVSVGYPLFEITRPESLQAWLPYPEAVALEVQIGQTVTIDSPLAPGETLHGTISDLQPTVGAGSRSVMAIIDLEDPGSLRPGATINGRVLVETRRNAVMAPIMAIVRRPAGEVVYIIEGDRAKVRNVVTGLHDGVFVEIESGLTGNETIAADGAAFLTDGAHVSITEPML
jgi:RND family efflux transporter MFP subunit